VPVGGRGTTPRPFLVAHVVLRGEPANGRSVMLIVTGQILRVRVAAYFQTQAAFNVYHYQVGAVVGVVSDVDLAGYFGVLGGVWYPPCMVNGSEYRGAGVQVIGPGGVALEVYDNGSATAGTGGTQALPQQTAGLVNAVTALAGRNQRARKFVPFPPDAFNTTTTGQPTGAYRTLLTSIGSAFYTTNTFTSGGNSATLIPVVDTTYTVLPRVISSFMASLYWSQQRRRSFLRRPDPLPFP